MKNYHLTTLLFTLFVCTANHAQITFDFTAGSFDVSGLPTGMYFLKSTSDGVTYDYYRFLNE